MSTIATRLGKLLLLPCALLCCLAVAATAQAEGDPPDPAGFCVAGHTETYGSADAAYWFLLSLDLEGGEGGYYVAEWDVNASVEQQVEDVAVDANPFEDTVFVPLQEGACVADPPGAPAHNHSPLCYSTYSDDVAYFDTGDIEGLLPRGYWVPAVIKSGDQYRFVCNWGSKVDANGVQLGSAANSGLVATGKKLGSDKTTIVSDGFAAGNDGWWEVLEPMKL
jgi:hypothetical protein